MTEITIINIGYTLIHKTGDMNEACRKWRNKPSIFKTLDNFKKIFTRKYKDCKENLNINSNNVYQANSVQLKEALETLVKATKNNQYNMVELSKKTTLLQT